MALVERLAILIDANGAGAVREFQKVGVAAERDLGKAETSAAKMSGTLIKSGAIMVGVGAVLVAGAYKAAEAFGQQEMADLKLQNTFANMPKLAGHSSDGLKAYAAALEKTTTFSDQATESAMSLLGTFPLTEEQIRNITPLVQDYAAKFGVDLDNAAKQVGKALDGQIGALRRNGVSIDAALYKTDKYAAVQKALREQVGGFAAQEAQTFSGSLARLGNQLHDVEEGVGKGAVEAFSKLLAPVEAASGALAGMDSSTKGVVGQVVAYGGAGLLAVGTTSVLTGTVMKMSSNLGVLVGKLKDSELGFNATGAASAAAAAGIVAAVMAIQKMNADSSANQTKLFGDIDFSDLEAANQKLDQTGQQINGLGSKWDSYSAAEKLAHAEDYKLWNDSAGQQEEHRKHLEAATQATNELAGATGMTAREAESLVKKLHIDPSAVPMDKLVKAINAYRSGAMDAAGVSQELGIAEGDVADGAEGEETAVKKVDKAIQSAADAKRSYQSALQHVDDAQYASVQASKKVAEAQEAAAQATKRIGDAEHDHAKAVEAIGEAQRSYEQSVKRVSDAEEARVLSLRKVDDAVTAVASAQQNLDDILAGGKHGDEYSQGIEQASINLARSKLTEADAEKKLADAKTPEERTKAALDLEQAKLDLARANEAQMDAGTAQSRDAAKASDDLAHANDGLTSAERDAERAAEAVSNAQHDAEKAAEAVTDAQYAAQKSAEAVGQAQRDAAHAADAIAAAQHDAARAARDVEAAQYDAVKALDAMNVKMAEQDKAFADNKGHLSELLAYYQDLANQAPQLTNAIRPLAELLGKQAATDLGGLVGSSLAHHAMGGPSGPGSVSVVGEHGPELHVEGSMGGFIVPNHALGGLPVRGGDGGSYAVSTPITVQLDGRTLAEALVPHYVRLEKSRR